MSQNKITFSRDFSFDFGFVVFGVLFCIVSMLGCSDSKLPKYVDLTELRVLTLIADLPETDPGSTVNITPVISDVTETTSLSYEAYGCIDPGVSSGASATCQGNTTQTLLAQGTLTSATNSEMSQNFTGSAQSFSVTIPSGAVIFSQRSSVDQYNGVSYLVTYKITNTTGKSVTAFKRIIVSNKASIDKNTNPTINNILSQGSALANNALPLNGKFSIQVELAASAAQSFPFKLSDESIETRTEDIITTWFISDGSLKYFRSTSQDANEFTAPETLPAGRKSFLFSVSRDSRGGVSVKRICGGC
jgi:hypothetical protein